MFAGLLRKTAPPGVTAIGVDREGVAIARLAHSAGRRPIFVAGEYYPFGDRAAPNTLMQTIAQKYHLQNAFCTSVLEGGDYKLLLTEAPDVPASELPAAMRWRIKDLIEFPVSEVTLDIIPVPNGSAGQQHSVYVVTARNGVIQRRVDLLKSAKVNLQIIDIAEMAQRNIAALLPQDQKGLAMLSLRPQYSLITLTRNNELYLSRTLSVGLEAIGDQQQQESAYNQVVLEIQRSLDYYESHFRQAPIRQLLLLPLPDTALGFVEYLRQNLSIEVDVIDLNDLVDHEIELSRELQSKIFLSFGAALRERAAA